MRDFLGNLMEYLEILTLKDEEKRYEFIRESFLSSFEQNNLEVCSVKFIEKRIAFVRALNERIQWKKQRRVL